MTDLDLTLTPAQWEHLDRHGWTLTVAPTEPSTDPTSAMLRAEHAHGRSLSSIARACGITRERVRQLVTATAPVPATVPCPKCGGTKAGYTITTEGYSYFACPTCSGSGVVPRTVGIVRPPSVLSYDGEVAHPIDPATVGDWYEDAVLPAERVGTATVTPVPVVDDIDDSPEEAAVLDVSTVLGVCWFWPEGAVNNGEESDVTALFATPPEPGTTVWRLDKENNR